MMESPVSNTTPTPAAPQLMTVIVDRDALTTEVAAAARAADPHGTPPILSHLHLAASEDGVLAITGCDLKRSIRSECAAEVKVPGTAAVQRRSSSAT
jgi:DNA polymerase-3 subunit beta